jgi:hypothetical protein
MKRHMFFQTFLRIFPVIPIVENSKHGIELCRLIVPFCGSSAIFESRPMSY